MILTAKGLCEGWHFRKKYTQEYAHTPRYAFNGDVLKGT